MNQSNPSYIHYDSEDENQEKSGHLNYNIHHDTSRNNSNNISYASLSYENSICSLPLITKKEEDVKAKEEHQIKTKMENSSTITLENQTPYLRRENFLQTFKAFMLYLDKLFVTDFRYIFPRNMSNFQGGSEETRLKHVQIISDELQCAFAKRGIHYENEVYRYLLEHSMNSPLLKQFGSQIFAQYLKDPETEKAFEREYNYKKGKINYFDPDFVGTLSLRSDYEHQMVCELRLHGFKAKLYLRVMMVMYKKLLRFLIFGKSGKSIFFDVDFTFSYRENQMNKMPMHHPTLFFLGQNKRIQFRYLQEEHFGDQYINKKESSSFMNPE